MADYKSRYKNFIKSKIDKTFSFVKKKDKKKRKKEEKDKYFEFQKFWNLIKFSKFHDLANLLIKFINLLI